MDQGIKFYGRDCNNFFISSSSFYLSRDNPQLRFIFSDDFLIHDDLERDYKGIPLSNRMISFISWCVNSGKEHITNMEHRAAHRNCTTKTYVSHYLYTENGCISSLLFCTPLVTAF